MERSFSTEAHADGERSFSTEAHADGERSFSNKAHADGERSYEPIILQSEQVVLTSNNETNRLIPQDCDIKGISIDYPFELDKVHVIIGNQIVATFDSNMIDELKTFPIYLSLLKYMYCRIEFEFNKQWLLDNEQYRYEDEYVEECWLGDELEVYDGDEYHVGKQVFRKEKPTGNKRRVITKGVTVTVPKIVFDIEPMDKNLVKIRVPVKQKINLTGADNTYKDYLTNKYNLKDGFVTNTLFYNGGMAGLTNVF
jgi:hypothetical protein